MENFEWTSIAAVSPVISLFLLLAAGVLLIAILWKMTRVIAALFG